MQCTWEEYLWNVSAGCFFPFAPIFCDGRNYSPPWQISVGSIREEQECGERNKPREPSGCKAQHDCCLMVWPLQLLLYSSTCCCLILTFALEETSPSHRSLLTHRQCEKMWGNTERDYSFFFFFFFSGNSFRCYPVSVCFSQTSIKDKRHRFGKCCCAEEEDFNTEVNAMQDVQDVKLKHSATILLLDRRKWDQAQSLRLMKTDPLCLGLLKEKDTWGTPLCLLNPPITS